MKLEEMMKFAALATLLGATSIQAQEWHPPMALPGPAETMGEIAGPYIAGALVGAATPGGRLAAGAAGALGVHAVGNVGAATGAGYGRYIDQTGNNPLLPSPIPGHSPRPGKSVLDSVSDAIGRALD